MSENSHSPARTEKTGESREVFNNQFVSLRVDPVRLPNGVEGSYAVVTSNTGFGSIVVPTIEWHGVRYFGVVEIHHYPCDTVGIEFPRVGTGTLDSDGAARELVEETGLSGTSFRKLGVLRPDTGLLTTVFAVWLATVEPELDGDEWVRHGQGFFEDKPGLRFAWLSAGKIVGYISNGRITCGMTLAAWAIIQSSGI